jgi:hypothetical protein
MGPLQSASPPAERISVRRFVLAAALIRATAASAGAPDADSPRYPSLFDALVHRDAADVSKHLDAGARLLEMTPDGVPAAFLGASTEVLRVLRGAGLAFDTRAPDGTAFFAYYLTRWPDQPAQDLLAAGWTIAQLERALVEIPVPLRIDGARSRVVPRRILVNVDAAGPRIAADGFTLVVADLEPEELFYGFDPGDPLEGVMPTAATPIRIEGPEADYRLEQRTISSIQIDMEGPHFELDWRAGVSAWVPLPKRGPRSFEGVARTTVSPGPYTLDELRAELRRLGPDHAAVADRVGLPPVDDAHAGVHVREVVTRIELRLSVKRAGQFHPITTIQFAPATGC